MKLSILVTIAAWLLVSQCCCFGSSPTSSSVLSDFDCQVRSLAVEYAFKIQPFRPKSSFRELVDTLKLKGGLPGGDNLCEDQSSIQVPSKAPEAFSPKFAIPPSQLSVFIDAESGDDFKHPGTLEKPFRTAHRAVEWVRSQRELDPSLYNQNFGIVFREGVYYFPRTIELGPKDSNLLFQNYNGEQVVLSGATLIKGGEDDKSVSWKEHETKVNVWKIDTSQANRTVHEATGLRIGRKRAVRARYPNGCSSDKPLPSGYKCMGFGKDGAVVDPKEGFGSNLLSEWVTADEVPMKQKNWFQYDVSDAPKRLTGQTFNEFQMGVGGTCSVFTPPAGYWCGAKCSGGAPPPPGCIVRYPKGVSTKDLPNAPYKKPGNAVVQAWRPGHWSSWMFQVSGSSSNATHLMFERGGFQGGRGERQGEAFFVENVEEELDADNEFFFDEESSELLYFSRSPTPPQGAVEVPTLKTLFVLRGTKEEPVTNVHLLGLVLRDTRLTYLDEHTMTSGGDWGFNLRAAIELYGVERVSVNSCTLEELDGNGILVKGYARDLVIQNNDFHHLGGNMIGLLGDTEGPGLPKDWGFGWDGSQGRQPRGTVVRSNFAYRCGLFAKQSSFLFQAKSMDTLIQNNIFFHGPRAGINFNDGFGGSNVIEGNLLFATVMETGDHGPFNSWDRQPYAYAKDKDGNYLMGKETPDEIKNNFLIGNYYSQETVDNDDGSQFYNTHHNFLVYAEQGLKSDFGGYRNYHHHNLYAFLKKSFIDANVMFNAGEEDAAWNNTVIFHTSPGALGSINCNCTLTSEKNRCLRMAFNAFYSPDGEVATLCGLTLQQRIEQGFDIGSTVSTWPSTSSIITKARELLGIPADALSRQAADLVMIA